MSSFQVEPEARLRSFASAKALLSLCTLQAGATTTTATLSSSSSCRARALTRLCPLAEGTLLLLLAVAVAGIGISIYFRHQFEYEYQQAQAAYSSALVSGSPKYLVYSYDFRRGIGHRVTERLLLGVRHPTSWFALPFLSGGDLGGMRVLTDTLRLW